MKDEVWFITGCSTGFGRELSQMALEKGYKVAVASRNLDDVADIVAKFPESAMAVKLDMTKAAEMKPAIEQIIKEFGRIDILVNNAGIGYFASMEESDEKEIRKMFEVNFFGLTKLIQLVLPVMRNQKSGHIINISSIGGLIGYPALSFYNATKFAVAGLSESLAKETAPLGIKVTIVCPSGFRTDWAGRSANEDAVEIEDYKETAGANKNHIRGYSGHQPGDPKRAANEIIGATELKEPPLYLLLGTAAYNNARKKFEDMQKLIDDYKNASLRADFPKE
jgi:NAD(P)-dependent dehydrogenase (short-subunit alcohol dehydrogenase family)